MLKPERSPTDRSLMCSPRRFLAELAREEGDENESYVKLRQRLTDLVTRLLKNHGNSVHSSLSAGEVSRAESVAHEMQILDPAVVTTPHNEQLLGHRGNHL